MRHNVAVYDEYGIADGYHDVNGQWPATSDRTRQLLRDAMGTPAAGPHLWFVDEGDSPSLLGPCQLVLEDGTDIGVVHALPSHLPIGYHTITPAEGGPDTLVVVSPRTCPPPPHGWGVAAQVYSLWRPDGWGVGDLRDVERLGQRFRRRRRRVPWRGGSSRSRDDSPPSVLDGSDSMGPRRCNDLPPAQA